MDLYDRQAIHKTWLEAARGDVRIVEDALRCANKRANNSKSSTTSQMVIEEIKKIVDR